MKVKAFLLKPGAFSLQRWRLWFTVSNAFEMASTITPALLPLFNIERHVLRRACQVLWFLRKLARYFESLGSIKEFA